MSKDDISSKKFQKKIEDFICDVCLRTVRGNGYTNHCPNCLHSKHVDINPGDRKAECFGIMKPYSIEYKSGEFKVIHICEKCGHIKKNKVANEDNMEIIYSIISRRSPF